MNDCSEILVPRESVNDEFVTVVRVYLQNGDAVKPGDELMDLETTKTTFSINAEEAGFVQYLCGEGQDVPAGSPVVRIHPNRAAALESSNCVGTFECAAGPRFSRTALRRIAELNIPTERFSGCDLVTIHDLPRHGIAQTARASAPHHAQPANVRFERLSRARKTEIARLCDVQSGNLTSSLSIHVETRGIFEQTSRSLQYLSDSLIPLCAYESARLLRRFRRLNAFFDTDRVAFYDDVHIGIAVDMDRGLKVVRVADADTKTMPQLDREIYSLGEKYLDDALTEDEISGTTFTITDLSCEGVHAFTPLINARQSAILAIAGADQRLGRTALTLVFDHRVTEGRYAAAFLREIKTRIESYRPACFGPLTNTTVAGQTVCSRCLKTLEEDLAMKGPGFIRIMDHQQNETYLCRPCFDGW